MTKKITLVFLGALMAFSGLFAVPQGAGVVSDSTAYAEAPGKSGSAFDRRITERFDSDRAMNHISHLAEEIGPRVAGTDEERESADYIQGELEQYGYEVSTQEFDIADRLEGHLQTSLSDDELAIRIGTGSASTDGEGVSGQVVHAGLGYEDDFPADVEGNIALIERGEFSFWEKAANATEAGAAGVIIYDNAEGLVPPTPSLGGNEASIPVVAVTQADGEMLLSEDDVTASLRISAVTDQTSQNVIAVKEPKGKPVEDPEIVYVTAHYDSVPYSPGASDNASGTSVVLEFARIMEAYPTEKEIRFIFAGAEEIGLVGSRYYVSQLSDDEINRSAANFNLDMVGTNWENATSLYVNVVDGAPNQVWQSASAAAERLDNDTLVLFERGASDHVAFYEAGIDAANFIRREPETASLEPWYHTPFDTIDKISQDRIQEAGELIGSAIYDFARKDIPGQNGNKNRAKSMNTKDYLLNEDESLREGTRQ
ncbi:M28 family peptidase [Alteribacter populi]|uniref:M28 family peptidase n=1 Tax=Alteribacter populi TaxID=2011011 RepID=UPI000BBB0920|nr:M28 family peptidase [Alteribacter populi]